ncbi:MarR family winged helix-turn-helix transcriptional regulator [Geobacter sp. AOG2]|uniref:MarR family winged helix-turn-helix transcriptional regulator n=1 Tax=Geobacter sp. AOG2 TaxID=1566347 RepID=UPI001CC7163A|nr:MarR family transcriptional regulator [Geobacter sp. AOG2]GFE62425.1 transcriptional regulator [Geobacter sp. AOG2]
MDQTLENSVGFIMTRTTLRYKNELGRRLKPYGVTPEQWVTLHRLREQDGLTQKELADQIFKDQPTITRILDKLEQKQLIRRSASPEDRRVFRVHLTDQGRHLQEQLMAVSQQVREEAGQGITERELTALKATLNKIWSNLA